MLPEVNLEGYINELSSQFENRKLVPFIGAGFTTGHKTESDRVLGGKKMRDLMIDLIASKHPEYSKESLSSFKFSDVADFFWYLVPKEDIHGVLRRHFVNVTLTELKKSFLSVDWPYVYTLNIDDGIEKNSKLIPVLPNRSLNENIRRLSCVYKLHGDARSEITYKGEKSIIFSRGQYLLSVKENHELLSLLRSDYQQNNLLFLGCSLEDEDDLRTIYEEVRQEKSNLCERLYVTDEQLSAIALLRLEIFGITRIVRVNTYQEFYQTLVEHLKPISSRVSDAYVKFKNIHSVRDGFGLKEALPYIYREYSSADIKSNEILVPSFTIERTLQSFLLEATKTSNFVLVNGKRCSGKTLLILNALNSVASLDLFYIPSDMSFEDDGLDILINRKNSIIFFDTNSLSYENAIYFVNHRKEIAKRNIHLVIALNNSDRIINSILVNVPEISVLELPNRLDRNENHRISDSLSRSGLIKFQESTTILDNVFLFADTYKINLEFLSQDFANNVQDQDLRMLIFLASQEKIYYGEAYSIGITNANIDAILERYDPFIQVEEVDVVERFTHSSRKVVSNSNKCLFFILGQFINNNSRGKARAISAVIDLVDMLHRTNNEKYKQITMFDNLNQIFSTQQRGMRVLIQEIYVGLEKILYQDPHYWLQRAKSILHLQYNSIEAIKLATSYAKKAVTELRDETKAHATALFTYAMLLGRLCNLEQFDSNTAVSEAIIAYHSALTLSEFNEAYIQDLLFKAKVQRRQNDFFQLCQVIASRSNQFRSYSSQIKFLLSGLRDFEVTERGS